MKLLYGVITWGGSETLAGKDIDFVVHASSDTNVTTPGNVRSYCTDKRCEGMSPVMTSPFLLADHIRATIQPGVRAMVGNAGSELTFRHIVSNSRKNVLNMLHWAKAAYKLLGAQLVLAPMDFDLIDDVKTGGRLLTWAAEHNVPLAIFCGFRFLFPEGAFPYIRDFCKRIPMEVPGNPYRYPYSEISEAIHCSGAEVWTGAGFHEGLAAGALDKAKEFGMAAVFTSQDAWNRWAH